MLKFLSENFGYLTASFQNYCKILRRSEKNQRIKEIIE